MSDDELIRENGKIQKKVSIEYPDREPGEDPITKNQLRYIKRLAPLLEIEGGLESLGKWQASAMIDSIKEQQELLDDDVADGKYAKGGCLGVVSLMMVSGMIISWLGS